MNVLRKALELLQEGEVFSLAVVVAKSGSAPQVPGAKSIFLRDGRIHGTIGGGCLEMEARRIALEAMHSGDVIVREFQLDDDFGWDDGLICGGRVQIAIFPGSAKMVSPFEQALESFGALLYDTNEGEISFVKEAEAFSNGREIWKDNVFIEPYLPKEKLYIFGAGHVGAAIGKLAAELNFDVVMIDDRAEFLTERRLPWAAERICRPTHEFAAETDFRSQDYLCLVTRGHRNDARVLREVIRHDGYIGMIGSRRKREVVRAEMLSQGICTDLEFERVKSPMGLDIGAESVTEIAVSVVAELIHERARRRGPIIARCGHQKLRTS